MTTIYANLLYEESPRAVSRLTSRIFTKSQAQFRGRVTNISSQVNVACTLSFDS